MNNKKKLKKHYLHLQNLSKSKWNSNKRMNTYKTNIYQTILKTYRI